ncbi:hypothetical protein BTS2_1713 [Bacillus sp. TS-2]|nr:hypothetical protein BTS2_1713 [Bacillus sp. TS-2]
MIFTLGRCFPKGLSSANFNYAERRQSGFSNYAHPLGVTTPASEFANIQYLLIINVRFRSLIKFKDEMDSF